MIEKLNVKKDFREEIETIKERIEDEQILIEDYQFEKEDLEYRISCLEDVLMEYVHQNRIDELENGIIESEELIDDLISGIESILFNNLDKLTKEELRVFNREFDIKKAA